MGFLLSLLCALQYPPMNVTVFHITSVYCLFNSFFWLTTKKSSKPRITGPLWGESTGYRWIPYTKGQYCGKYFHEMTSSWSSWYDQCYTFVSAKLHATSHYILDQAPVPLTVFWWNMLHQSQRNFALVQNFIVIGKVHFKPAHSKFQLNFEFHRNIVSGTGLFML